MSFTSRPPAHWWGVFPGLCSLPKPRNVLITLREVPPPPLSDRSALALVWTYIVTKTFKLWKIAKGQYKNMSWSCYGFCYDVDYTYMYQYLQMFCQHQKSLLHVRKCHPFHGENFYLANPWNVCTWLPRECDQTWNILHWQHVTDIFTLLRYEQFA